MCRLYVSPEYMCVYAAYAYKEELCGASLSLSLSLALSLSQTHMSL